MKARVDNPGNSTSDSIPGPSRSINPSPSNSSVSGAGSLISQLLAKDPVFNPRARRGRGGGARGRTKNSSALSDIGLEVDDEDGGGGEEDGGLGVVSQGGEKKKKKGREYVPKYRSGAYAVLVALYQQSKVRLLKLIYTQEINHFFMAFFKNTN